MSKPPGAALRATGLAAGLDAVGWCSADPFPEVRATLEQRRAEGLHATMAFTYRNPARSTDPSATLPSARSLVVGARSYHRATPPRPAGRGPQARTARYVWGDDQEQLRAGLASMAEALRENGFRAVVLSDQNNLVDRAVAHRAGLGWFGKNTNLLLPGIGSWFLLGAVLTDAVLDDGETDAPGEGSDAAQPKATPDPSVVPDGCGSCTRCLPACPTGALVAPGVLDARRCLSWTLQATGTFPVDQRIALGDRIYGCDDCQDACPPNRVQVLRRAPGRTEDAAAVDDERPIGDADRAWIDLLELLDATDEELLDRHGRWYIARRQPRHLRRNALVVLGNIGDGHDPATRAALGRCLAAPDPLVRSHAVWSARRLGCDDLLMAVRDDPDLEVQRELTGPVPVRTWSATAMNATEASHPAPTEVTVTVTEVEP